MLESDETIHLNLKDALASPASRDSPKVKPAPDAKAIPVPFAYCQSDDGVDENLLILLHGLGDTHVPFSKLARQLKLPQTATLALRAPEQIPFLHEDSFQWFTSFDGLGELLERPDPTPALDLLSQVVDHLVRQCQWRPEQIHFFGFAQGGSLAAQFAVHRWTQGLLKRTVPLHAGGPQGPPETIGPAASVAAPFLTPFGSVVSVCGALFSVPSMSEPCPTPIFIAYRPLPAEPAVTPSALSDLKQAYCQASESRMAVGGVGMPASRADWEPIMRFWSEKLGRRTVDGLYEVTSRRA